MGDDSGAGGSAESYLSENGSLSYVGAFEATGINAAGQVIGYRATPLLDLRGLLWQAGASREIGIPDDRVLPRDINNAGQVVGSMWRNGYSERAFIWEDGLTRDLNDTIPTDTGWELRRATGLNNMGQIVGYGQQDGEERAFIVTRGMVTPFARGSGEPTRPGRHGCGTLPLQPRLRLGDGR